MLSDASIRWISARGHGGDEGISDRVKFGIFLDVTARRQADELREMHAGEMSHRIKNLFAIASALTTIASRTATTTAEMARDLIQRLTALGQAHDLVHPTARQSDGGYAQLSDLLTVLLAPYDEVEGVGDRVHVAVPDTRVGMTSATTLALVIHELATNSVKYGALSASGGRVDITGNSDDDDLVIVWVERGGPVVTGPNGPGGFGSSLVSRSVSGQLGGSIAFDWPPGGAVITLRLSKGRLQT